MSKVFSVTAVSDTACYLYVPADFDPEALFAMNDEGGVPIVAQYLKNVRGAGQNPAIQVLTLGFNPCMGNADEAAKALDASLDRFFYGESEDARPIALMSEEDKQAILQRAFRSTGGFGNKAEMDKLNVGGLTTEDNPYPDKFDKEG